MKPKRTFSGLLILMLALPFYAVTLHADVPGIKLGDSRYTASLIDSDDEVFFVSQTTDLAGRLFVGAREGLYVYEPDGEGFGPRQELYQFPKDSWLYDLEVHGNDLYVLCNTALYIIRDAITKRSNLKPEKLLWGMPQGHFHQGLHGMEFGPTGDLFLSMGDPQPHMHWDRSRPDHLWHWTFFVGPESRKVDYTGVGAVFRYRLADHELTVHASGLRNTCGISFDPNWHLFGNDNDQEGAAASPGRLAYIPRHSWHGWVRGWSAQQHPKRRDLLPVVNLELDVPVGQCWHDGAVLVANWGNRAVSRHAPTAVGAGFVAPTDFFLTGEGQRRPVSVIALNDGRLVVAVCYMEGNEGSPVRKTDLLLIASKESTAPQDWSKAELAELLDQPWQIRYKAHQEILRRGGADLKQSAARFLTTAPDAESFSSLIYLAAVQGDAASLKRIHALAAAGDADSELPLRVMAEFPDKFAPLDLEAMLAKGLSPLVRHALLEYLHATPKLPLPQSIAGIAPLAADTDAFVRQSAAQLLARRASLADLTQWATSSTESLREAAVNAAGFHIWEAIEATTRFPKQREEARAKQLTFEQADGQVKLSDVFIFMPSEWWRDAQNQQSVAGYYQLLTQALSDPSPTVHLPAAVQLFFLKNTEVDQQVVTILDRNGVDLGSKSKSSENAAAQKKALRALKSVSLSVNEQIPPAFEGIDWNAQDQGGQATKGKDLFTTRGCIACHLAPDDGKGGSIGPSLVGVHQRFSAQYLAESILLPNRFVSPNFHPTTLTMKDKTIHTGFIESEGAEIELRMITGTVMNIPRDQIAERTTSHQSMMPAGLVQTPAEMRHLLAYMLEKEGQATDQKNALTDWETTGNWKLDEAGADIEIQRRIQSLEPNVFRFPPTKAKFVRIDVLRSSSKGQPCIDELEIFSGDSPENLALQSNGAKASASSLLSGYDKHRIEHLNDGKYGNLHSWIPAKTTGWAQIELPETQAIDQVVLSRDRGGKITDRTPIAFDILISSDGKNWKTVKKVRPPQRDAAVRPFIPAVSATSPEVFALENRPPRTVEGPNIIVILADDFGWGDTSCNNPDSPLKTPAIDRIATEGIRFTNAHTPSAVCTPTRYGLLTGRYPWRSYLKKEVLPYYAPALITSERTTIASYLKSQGYRTGGFGKWHLGLDWTPVEGDPANWRSHWNTREGKMAIRVSRGIDHTKPFKNGPTDVGFDTYFGTPSNCTRLPFFIEDTRVFGQPKPDKSGGLRDPACARDTVDDIYVNKAIDFMETHLKQHAERPFFVYLPLNAIHGAVSTPKRFKGKNGMADREDKILWVNESVGRIHAALDRMNLINDTLLIFTTDNGPIISPTANRKGHESTGPYRGLKTSVWDGGTRVPFVARWPGHIPAGATTDQLIGLTDLLATVAAICGKPLPEGAGPDSVNQLPALLQQKENITQRPPLVTASYAGFLTLRNDTWKAVFGTKWTGGHPSSTYGGPPPKGTPQDDPAIGQLFNITNDPFEKEDLWSAYPEVVKVLQDELQRIKELDKADTFPGR